MSIRKEEELSIQEYTIYTSLIQCIEDEEQYKRDKDVRDTFFYYARECDTRKCLYDRKRNENNLRQ